MWITRYQVEGFNGLFIRPGPGRKPAYADTHAEEASARAELLHLIRRASQQSGGERSRWRLSGLRQACDWLKVCALAEIWQLLESFDIRCKRGMCWPLCDRSP